MADKQNIEKQKETEEKMAEEKIQEEIEKKTPSPAKESETQTTSGQDFLDNEKSQKTETPEIQEQDLAIIDPSELKSKFPKKKEEKIGIAYVKSSSNNTIVHITDLAGNTISRVSGGMVTKHSRMKSNPTIAMFVAKKVAERARDLGFTSLYVRMKGKTGENTGPGAHAAVKSLGKEGFNIISILDTTKFPRGGPKKKGGRRGRRV